MEYLGQVGPGKTNATKEISKKQKKHTTKNIMEKLDQVELSQKDTYGVSLPSCS